MQKRNLSPEDLVHNASFQMVFPFVGEDHSKWNLYEDMSQMRGSPNFVCQLVSYVWLTEKWINDYDIFITMISYTRWPKKK